MVVGGCLGRSDHEMLEFSILGEVRRGTNRASTMDFKGVDFGLFGRLTKSLGSQSQRAKESRKTGCASKRSS